MEQYTKSTYMPKQMDPSHIAICGMHCLVCYKHLITKKYAKQCHGCRYDDETLPAHCRSCKIKDCAKEKNYTYCFECNVYPCHWIKNLDKSYQKRYKVSLIENGMFMKEFGISAFLDSEKKHWTCTACQGIISLHDRFCSVCQKTMDEEEPV